MPALFFSRVQNKSNTTGVQLAMGTRQRHSSPKEGRPQMDREIHG
jgi:hypothetical protein